MQHLQPLGICFAVDVTKSGSTSTLKIFQPNCDLTAAVCMQAALALYLIFQLDQSPDASGKLELNTKGHKVLNSHFRHFHLLLRTTSFKSRTGCVLHTYPSMCTWDAK